MIRKQKSAIDSLHNHSIEELMQIGIYTITSKVNGKIYVGCTSRTDGSSRGHIGFKARWECHVTNLIRGKHNNNHLQNHVNKYGINDLWFEILEICEAKYVESLELYWIHQLDSVNQGFNQVYSTKLYSGKNHPQYKDLERYHIIIALLYKLGLSSPYIAEQFNVSESKIKAILNSQNANISRRRNYADINTIYKYYLNSECSTADVAEKFDMSYYSVYRLFKENNLKLKIDIVLENLENIFTRYKNGENIKNLANEFKVHYTTLLKQFKKHNLK